MTIDLYPGTFGAGRTQPYETALSIPGTQDLFLHDLDSGRVNRMDVVRFASAADPVDVAALTDLSGPVLDVGCGPGRMVRAAIDRGLIALGVDVSPAAVSLAQRAGLPVIRRSVFERVPGEGQWASALLLDGNIGIGGDPLALLDRIRTVVAPRRGRLLVEAHPEATRDADFIAVLRDASARDSDVFPWAERGVEALHRDLDLAGFVTERTWTRADRTFVLAVRP